MKTIIRILICLAIGLVLSLHDVAWPEDNKCDWMFKILFVEEDQDQNRVVHIAVDPWVQGNPTDSVCLWFGRCVLALFDDMPAMGAVSIDNPPDEWVPSLRRWITYQWALELAEDERVYDLREVD